MSARSEKFISVGDRDVKVLFTNRALAEAEGRLGKTVIQLAAEFEKGAAGVSEIAILLRSGMEAARRDDRVGGQPITLNDAYDVLDEVGFVQVATIVMTALAEVLSFGTDENQKN